MQIEELTNSNLDVADDTAAAGGADNADQDTSAASQVAGDEKGASADAKVPAEEPDQSFEEMLAEAQNSSGTPTPDPKATPASSKDDALYEQLARDMGVSDEKIAKMKSAGLLADFATSFDRKILADAAAARQTATPPKETPAPTPPKETPAPQQPDPAKPAPLSFNWKDEYGEEAPKHIRENVEALHGHFASEINAFRGQIANVFKEVVVPMQKDLQGLANMLAQERVDNMIGQLGSEWEETFGKGPTDELDPKSAQAVNRQKLIDSAAGLINWEHQKGRSTKLSPSFFKRALAASFSDKLTQTTRKQVAQETQQAKGQRSHPPTMRRAVPKPTGDDEAVQAAAEGFAKYGLPDRDAS